jgi:site-specific DNA recombinase
VRAALYARVSTEAQADRGTIGSQLALLREHVTAADDELVGEYVDDGHSGARLDRPGPAWTRYVMPPRPGSSNGCGNHC